MEDRLARAKQCVHDCKVALRDAETIYAELLSIDDHALSAGAAELIDLYGPGTILMAYETGRLMYEKSVVPVPLERLKVKVSLSGTAMADILERLSIDIASLLNREIQLQVKRDIAAKVAHHTQAPVPGITAMQCMRLHNVEPDKWTLMESDKTSYITNSVLFGRLRSRDYQVWLALFQDTFKRDPFCDNHKVSQGPTRSHKVAQGTDTRQPIYALGWGQYEV